MKTFKEFTTSLDEAKKKLPTPTATESLEELEKLYKKVHDRRTHDQYITKVKRYFDSIGIKKNLVDQAIRVIKDENSKKLDVDMRSFYIEPLALVRYFVKYGDLINLPIKK